MYFRNISLHVAYRKYLFVKETVRIFLPVNEKSAESYARRNFCIKKSLRTKYSLLSCVYNLYCKIIKYEGFLTRDAHSPYPSSSLPPTQYQHPNHKTHPTPTHPTGSATEGHTSLVGTYSPELLNPHTFTFLQSYVSTYIRYHLIYLNMCSSS